MKPMLVIGTRPQIIKASVLIDAFRQVGCDPILVHTGQHYDTCLSEIFFQELKIIKPNYNLHVGSGNYRYQIQEGVQRLLKIIDSEEPDVLLTIGDSNPSLVGSLSALIRKICLAHSEAGLRSGNIQEPEERNRIFIDSISDYLFCSTQECLENLDGQVDESKLILSGDLLYDTWKQYQHLVEQSHPNSLNDIVEDYCLFTLHRKSTAYNPRRLALIVNTLISNKNILTVWPIHPGVRKELEKLEMLNILLRQPHIRLLPPSTYLEMRWLERHSSIIVTDSVGLQVEAYLAKKPSIILRNEIEYTSLEKLGWSTRVSPNKTELSKYRELIQNGITNIPNKYDETLFGTGNAAYSMATAITTNLTSI